MPQIRTNKSLAALNRFSHETRGQVAVMMCLTAVPVVALAGAGIDYGRAISLRTKVQYALDGAALAAAKYAQTPQSGSLPSNARVKAYARTAARARFSSSAMKINSVTVATTAAGSKVCIDATTQSTVSMINIVGINSVAVGNDSCASTGFGSSIAFEVAIVMDTTGSMAESAGGTTKLQSATASANTIVGKLNSDPANPVAAISVVPFAAAVNVGTANKSASWLDQNGASSIHWQNYTRPSGTPWLPTSRFDLFAKMNIAWGGCVEERPDPYLVTDTPASTGDPDSLFVPYLWPDEGGLGTGISYPGVNNQTPPPACDQYTSTTPLVANPDWPACLTAPPLTGGSGTGSWPGWTGYATNSGAFRSWNSAGSNSWSGTYGTRVYTTYNSYLSDNGGTCQNNDKYAVADVNDRVSHGSGATKICKYDGQSPAGSSAFTGLAAGPNLMCNAKPIVPLTTQMSDITGSSGILSQLTPAGDTNILSGFMWGWRTLSPNGPFASVSGGSKLGPIAPSAYDGKRQKIIILLTDGYNHWTDNPQYPYGSAYNALGYYVNNRVAGYGNQAGNTNSSNYRSQMDAALIAGCTNARKAGVRIYTIGVSIPSDPIDATGLATLQKCAGTAGSATNDASMYFVASNSSDISNAFLSIANDLNKLKLTQ